MMTIGMKFKKQKKMLGQTKISLKWPLMMVTLVGIILAACSKMDGTYKDFIKDGEIRYSQKPDTIGINPGHYRVRAWIAAKRNNLSKFKVFWNNRADSIEVPIAGTTGNDTLSVVIENLMEGSYTFEFFTYDKEGNTSIVVDTVGDVYGDEYIGSLANRLVDKASLIGDNLDIVWFPEINHTVVRSEVKYKDQDGTDHEIWVAREINETVISDKPLNGSLMYRTVYLPHPNALDTFYTDYTDINPTRRYEGFPETFEDPQYRKASVNTNEDVQMSTGLWRFDLFITGNAAGDRKNGAWCVRSHGSSTSILETLFDLPDGASKISFYHGICSADESSEFKVQASQDGGTTWEDISEVYTNTTTLMYREIPLDIEGPVRFRFYRLPTATGTNRRMNIDDIDIHPRQE